MFLTATSPCFLNYSRDSDSSSHWSVCSNALPLFLKRIFFLISSLNIPRCNLRPLPLILELGRSFLLQKQTLASEIKSCFLCYGPNHCPFSFCISFPSVSMEGGATYVPLTSDTASRSSKSLSKKKNKKTAFAFGNGLDCAER